MRLFFKLFFLIASSASFGFCIWLWMIAKTLPDPRFLEHYTPSSVVYLYDRNEKPIQEWGSQYRSYVSYAGIPHLVIQAFLYAEDKYFFQHMGVDFISLARSFIHNMDKKNKIGGSTITQQIAKNFIVGDEKTILRKIKEAILAFKIEYYLPKPKILEIYLNHIYLGRKTFGIKAAARQYFDKPLTTLTPSDMAFLAALAKYPSARNIDRIIQRRNWILRRMRDDFLISQKIFKESITAPLPNPKKKVQPDYAHYFVESLKRQIGNQKAEHIVSTLHPSIQKIVEKTLKHHLLSYNQFALHPITGGVVVMNAKTGEVLAEAGGCDYKKQKFDCATQAKRQIGSLFKPFVYLAAFEKGIKPSLSFYDQPLEFDGGLYRPKNFSGTYYGKVSIHNAFCHSHNLITLQLAQYIGMPSIVRLVRQFGIFPEFRREWASVLGACETTLLNITSAYACMVNGGFKIMPTFIVSKDTKNVVVQPKVKILSNDSVFQIRQLMMDTVLNGTAKLMAPFQKVWTVGGKTGTTNNNKDVWFVGFVQTPSNHIYTIGVFLGALSPKPLGEKMTGGFLATPLAYNVLREIYEQGLFA